MIENFGIGIDIVEINRFKKIPYNKKKSFYNKIFQPREITYCLKFSDSYRHFAGKFAVKEALKKSILDEVDFLEIETDYSCDKPIVKLKNDKKYHFLISVTHEFDIAIAVVISEKIN